MEHDAVEAPRSVAVGRPPSRREDVVDEIHGTKVADPYRWLERADAAEVVRWSEAQHGHARRELDALPHRDALRHRLRELLYYDSLSPPRRFGTREFYARRHADKEKAIYYVREAGVERVLLDPNAMSKDGSLSIHGVFPSHDGRYVAYKVSRNNADAATLHLLDLDTGRELVDERIDGARYAAPSWLRSSGFYYTALPTDPSIPPSELPGRAEVRLHRIGTAPSTDELVHPASHDPTTFVHAEVTDDAIFMFLTIWRGFDSHDVWFRDLRRLDSELVPLSVGTKTRARVLGNGPEILVHTNDGAPRYRVMRVDPARPRRSEWRELVPEGKGTLQRIGIVGGHLWLEYLERASSRLELRTREGEHVRDIPLPGIGTTTGLVGDSDDAEAYFEFSSFTTFPRIYRTRIDSGHTELWHERQVPADTSAYEVEQVEYRSKDGTPITMFVVHHRDVVLDGNNPTLLGGYGGFGVSMTPTFATGVVLWLEHGGVFAVPNLRGGGEYGEPWHEAGKLHNKQNVFDDFIAAAQWLIDNGWTRPDRLAIRGGSNGGLLVGAVSTQRPELFGAVVCAVPLLDMIRYHRFGAGRTWTSEYGSAEDPGQFRTLFAYSPYHRIVDGAAYPPLLMLAADSDDRVDPMHARKYVAAMQAATDPDTPVLLRIERNAGHGGGDNVRQTVEQDVDVYAFLFAQLGIAPPER